MESAMSVSAHLAAAVALGIAASGTAPRCHDAKGRPQPCPQSPVAFHCHDAQGREARCGTPGARPAGVKTEKPGHPKPPHGAS
jgi:hypothetical protein